MKLTVVIEKGNNCFGAYIKELPGCFAHGKTMNELESCVKEAVEIHCEVMMELGEDPIDTDNIEFKYTFES